MFCSDETEYQEVQSVLHNQPRLYVYIIVSRFSARQHNMNRFAVAWYAERSATEYKKSGVFFANS
jgi:hypothetical protein